MDHSEARRSGRGCLKVGCAGVAVLLGLVLVWSGLLFGVAAWRAKHEHPEQRKLVQDLPPAPGGVLDAGVPAPAAVGRVELDFHVGEFRVRPGVAGDPVRVSAEYDPASYVLEDTFEPTPDGGWAYRVRFAESSRLRDGGLRAFFGGTYPSVTVWLPPGTPLALSGRFGKGATDVELDGLWLTELDLEFEKGALVVDFDPPPAFPVEQIRVRSKQGGLVLQRLGNASPRVLDIDHRMGGMSLDLRGAWVRDADVRIASKMGGAEVRLPTGVKIEGLDRPKRLAPPTAAEIEPPTLTMTVSSFLGAPEFIE